MTGTAPAIFEPAAPVQTTSTADTASRPDTPAGPSPTLRKLLPIGLVLVIAAYLVQLPTPLRMNTDGISYFLLAASFHDGHGFVLHNHRSHFPPGYPAVISMVERSGIHPSLGLVAWNDLMLAIGLVAGVRLLQNWLGLSPQSAMFVALLTLLSRATIRYSTIPASECSYFGLSMLSLLCLSTAEEHATDRSIVSIASRWTLGVLFIAAILFRTIGIVLVPAAAWSLVLIAWRRRTNPEPLATWIARHRRPLIPGAAAALVIGIVGLYGISRTAYFKEGLSLITAHGYGSAVSFIMRQRLMETGSTLTNLWSRNDPTVRRLMLLAGIAALPLILLVVARRLRNPVCVDVYLLGYIAVLLVWPYKADNRFWMPVQMLLLGLLARELLDLTALPRLRPAARIVATLWTLCFIVSGSVALVQSTRLTYAGSNFSEVYDLEFFRDTYRAASPHGVPANPATVNPDLLYILQRYGKPDFN